MMFMIQSVASFVLKSTVSSPRWPSAAYTELKEHSRIQKGGKQGTIREF